MAFQPSLSLVLDTLGGLLFLVLGLYVWRVAPGLRRNRAFGLFAAAFGAYFALANASPMFEHPLGAALPWILSLCLAVAGVGGLWLAYALADRMTGAPRGPFTQAVVIGAAFLAVHVVLMVLYSQELVGLRRSVYPSWTQAGIYTQLVAFSAGGIASLFVVLYALALSYGPEVQAPSRTEARLVTIALGMYLGFMVGATRSAGWGISSGLSWSVGATVLGVGTMVGVAGVWLDRAGRVPESATLRNIAVFLLAMPLLGLVVQSLGGPFGAYGVTRTIGVLVLTYGILKHELLGIDRRVRWGVSKTTVTGVFVSVFFVVSEGAQALFQDFAGNEFLGILAAGGLLFALAPIQRLADRIAERAVPVQEQASSAETPERRQELYRSTVRRFLRDGRISDDEEQELFDLAEELGIGAGEANRIRRSVRAETEA